MRSLFRRLRHGILKAFGVDPEPVIATLWLGPEAECQAMDAKMRELLPGYRHIVVKPTSRSTTRADLAKALRHNRTGMIAALPQGWSAALLNAPRRTMAFNSRGENWFLKWSSPISTLAFLRGVPIDRITLRPWFWPGERKPTITPDKLGVIEGRPTSPVRAPFAVLSPYLPWPLAHGGAVRIYSLLREASREFDIHLYAFLEDGNPPDVGPLKELCHRITYVEKPHYWEPRWSTVTPPEVWEYRSPAMQRALTGVKPLQVEYTQLASYRADILVEHDVTFDLYTQLYKQKRSLSSWWNLYRWKRFEERAVRRSLPVVMSDKDKEMLGVPRAHVIGNGVDLDRFQPTPERTGRRLLFIGSFRHFPNATAFYWFWTEVWPKLKGCQLTVVAGPEPLGHWRNATGERDLPTANGLDFRSFVADVKPLYDEANVVIVPTLVSAGTNLKVLEAMAMRRAVVSTPSGVAGIGLTDGVDVSVAEGAEEFAADIERLLGDDALRTSMADRAAALAHARYSWRSLSEAQAKLWHEFSPSPLQIERGPSPTRDFASYPANTARLKGKLVGHITWRDAAADEHEVLWLETEPSHRRMGIAERLLRATVQECPGQWFLEVRESNEAAQRLYEKLGFEIAGRRKNYYTHPEEDALVMRRLGTSD